MMYPTLKLLTCIKQKLRWMILSYWKTTNDVIGSVGRFYKNGSILTLLWISLTKEMRLWKTHWEWLLRINATLFNFNTTFKEKTTNQNQHQMKNLQIFGIMHQTKLLRWFLLYAVQQPENSFPRHKCETYANIKLTCRK